MKSNTKKSALEFLATVAGVVLTTGLTVDGSANLVQAADFTYSYSGDGVEANGVLTIGDSTDANGYLTITGITGQRNGATITALLPPGSFPNDVPPFGVPNDNLLSLTQPFLSFNGFSYLVGAQPENVFYYQDVEQYAETDDPNGNPGNYRLLNNFNLQRVPEPSFGLIDTLGLATVLGSGLVLKRNQKKYKLG